ncbi:hypothetical protein K402DRAFT_250104 [Aulographum hederae CBS 113979]|uniref:Uncharacterized protein n=1 Tax=Aulographum hederae CBS 113979 TaxID=1176131 RepID=A0A6G1GJY1_9PEZI|nr:hypothetical protein K402DRAFT_250104 [Aulographum hederae CBS 113979]
MLNWSELLNFDVISKVVSEEMVERDREMWIRRFLGLTYLPWVSRYLLLFVRKDVEVEIQITTDVATLLARISIRGQQQRWNRSTQRSGQRSSFMHLSDPKKFKKDIYLSNIVSTRVRP